MNAEELRERFAEAQADIAKLHRELDDTNRSMLELTLELDERAKNLSTQLHAAHAELQRTNSELMQLTLELEDRVNERTAELSAAHAELQRTNTEMLQLTLELESRVAERTAELQRAHDQLEEKVRERTAQLETANTELEAFSYSVSHDLRAPLRTIDGFSQALLEDCHEMLDDEGKSHLHRVQGAARRMSELVDALLGLSRVTRSDLKYESVELSGIARAVAGDLQQRDSTRKATFKIEDGLVVKSDAALMKVLLENLLDNSWKFTSKHTEPRIEFGAKDEGRETVYFVRDNGAGFEMAYANKLFTPFQRLHANTEYPGTGIGLATVQRIIHRHGGRVWAESTPGQGATFYFTLSTRDEVPTL